MSDRIDELVASADPHMKWLCQRLNVQGTGYEGGPDDRALREVKKAMSQLATIAREAEARALKWREAAFCVAYAWWEQDEDSATDYLLERGWDIGELSFEALVEDVRQQPHPTALEAAREAVK